MMLNNKNSMVLLSVCVLVASVRAGEPEIGDYRCTQVLMGHADIVNSLAFSPDTDDSILVSTGSYDKSVKLWNPDTGELIQTLNCETNVYSVAFNSDANDPLFAVASYHVINLWNYRKMESLFCLKGHDYQINSVAFSPDLDNPILASGSDDGTIKLWNLHTGECMHTLTKHTDCINSVVFSPDTDNPILASGSGDCTIKLWNPHTGECLGSLDQHTGTVTSLVFSPNGKILISGSRDRTIRLWDIETRECVCILRGHAGLVQSLALSPDGRTLASGSFDKSVRLWNVGDYCQVMPQFKFVD